MPSIVLYGFDGSTYVRTVKMLMEEKGFHDFEQVMVNVLEGEPRQPEHLQRHPFGKVPVLDYDGFRILETSAITRFLDTELPGKSLIPTDSHARARMDMTICLIDSYGYNALVAVAGFYLFPQLVGGKNDDSRKDGIDKSRQVLTYLMGLRGDAPFIAGDLSLADLFLAPLLYYIGLTPDRDAVMDVPGLADYWQRLSALPSYVATDPKLG